MGDGDDDDDDDDDCGFPAVLLNLMKSLLCWLRLEMCGYYISADSHDVFPCGVKTEGSWKLSGIG